MRSASGAVDLYRFTGEAFAALLVLDVVERAHVVQAVGEFDEEDADVLAHSEDEFAKVFGLLGAVRLQLKAGEVGDAINKAADHRAEPAVDLGLCYAGVLYDVV